MLLEEGPRAAVASGGHESELLGSPSIERGRAHERQVDTESTVCPGAGETDEHAVRNGGPGGVLRGAVEADLESFEKKERRGRG